MISEKRFSVDRCSLHVQLEQCGVRTPRCTIQGNLEKPADRMALRDDIWITSLEYSSADPDLLRDCTEKIVDEINTHNLEDVIVVAMFLWIWISRCWMPKWCGWIIEALMCT